MKLAIERLHKVFQLSSAERLILGQAWGLFLLADLALRILPFTRLLTLSNKVILKQKGGPSSPLNPSVSRLAWLVDVASRYTPVTSTCLKKALVLSWLLGWRGARAQLRIGVARHEGSLKAHAWLDYDGQVIIGLPRSDRYEVLFPTG